MREKMDLLLTLELGLLALLFFKLAFDRTTHCGELGGTHITRWGGVAYIFTLLLFGIIIYVDFGEFLWGAFHWLFKTLGSGG